MPETDLYRQTETGEAPSIENVGRGFIAHIACCEDENFPYMTCGVKLEDPQPAEGLPVCQPCKRLYAQPCEETCPRLFFARDDA